MVNITFVGEFKLNLNIIPMKHIYFFVLLSFFVHCGAKAQSSTKSEIKKTGKEIGHTGKKVGKEVGKTGKNIGHAFKKPAKQVGREAKSTGKQVGRETKKLVN